MFARMMMFFAALGLSATLAAQTGHPAKGSWSGDLKPASAESTRIRLLIDDHNGELSGAVNPGRNGIDMKSVVLDPSTWSMKITAALPEGELVLDGKLNNLGSWTNRKYTGTYTLGSTSGTFDITLN